MDLNGFTGLNKILPLILYSASASLLLQPWFRLYSPPTGKIGIGMAFFLWIFFLEAVLIILAAAMAGIKSRGKRILLLLFVLAVDLIFILAAGWPLLSCLTVSLILVIPALRFNNYYCNIDFERDFILVILLYLLNLLIFDPPYSQVLLFFFSMISLAVIMNMQKMNSRGYPWKLKRALLVVVVFTAVVYLTAVISAFAINEAVFQGMLSAAGWLYFRFVDLLVMIIKPLVWLITPLLTFILNLSISLFKRDLSPQNPGIHDREPFFPENPPTTAADISIFFWIVFYLLLLGLIVLLIFRLKGKKDGEIQEKGVLEERESLFSSQVLLQDLQVFFRGLAHRFSRRGRKNYDRSSPLMIIREIYHQFLLQYNTYLPRRSHYTPNEYLRRLKTVVEAGPLQGNIAELTSLYNRARYGEICSKEEAERAGELWERIRQGPENSGKGSGRGR